MTTEGTPFIVFIKCLGGCHARFGPRLISVRPDQKRLPEIVRPDNFRCSILSHVTFFGPTLVLSVLWKVLKMSSESGTDEEGDTLELAYSYKVKGKYPEGCDANKKRSIRPYGEINGHESCGL